MNWLFQANDGTGFGSNVGVIGSHNSVRPCRETRPEGSHELLAEVSIDQSVAVHSVAIIHWGIPDQSSGTGRSLHLAAEELPFDVWLKVRICRTRRVSNQDIRSCLDVGTDTNHGAWNKPLEHS